MDGLNWELGPRSFSCRQIASNPGSALWLGPGLKRTFAVTYNHTISITVFEDLGSAFLIRLKNAFLNPEFDIRLIAASYSALSVRKTQAGFLLLLHW
ncbi:MAG: hypothetical protein AAF149_24215 [Bacteroidota bacterium]